VPRSRHVERVKAWAAERHAGRPVDWQHHLAVESPVGRVAPDPPAVPERDPEEALRVDGEPVRHRAGQFDLEKGPAIGDLTAD